MPDLSVIIPARNETYLRRTVEDVLANIRGDTEIIVILDGEWAEPQLEQHPLVTVIHHPESIGQRGGTNEGARVSTAKYVMKLDAHCSVAEGFDVELMRAAGELGRYVTQIPAQKNLHAFDWMCDGCGKRTYQGPTPTKCEGCGGETLHREMVWKPRRGVTTTAWRFDQNLHFQYWGEHSQRETTKAQGDFPETMSCLGACFFMERERYWELGGLDEAHGTWGQMGTEVGCKSWLSGGRMVTNRRTWFAHMFRTQGGDFTFPWPISGRQVDRARAHSRELWIEGKWEGARHPLSWLIERFAPVPGWEVMPAAQRYMAVANREAQPAPSVTGAGSPSKGVVYYSDCRGDETILAAARAQLLRATNGHRVVGVTLAPVDLAQNIIFAGYERGVLTMFRQILAGLEACDAEVVFLAEHDVLYHPSHFDFVPPRADTYYYNVNTWKVDAETGRALHYITRQTSGLCASRKLLLEHYRARVERVEREGFTRRMGFEPGTHRTPRGVDDHPSEEWRSAVPNIDIRHGHNLTPSRWSREQFRNPGACLGWTEADEVPGWGHTAGRFNEFLREALK